MEQLEEGNDVVLRKELSYSRNYTQETGVGHADGQLLKFISTLTEPLLKLACPTEISFPPIGKAASHPSITQAMAFVHVRALDCLNNLFLSFGLSSDSKSVVENDAEAMHSIWNELWTILHIVGIRSEPGQEQRAEMWNSAMGALWGVAQACRAHLVCFLLSLYVCRLPNANQCTQVADEHQIRTLIEFYKQASNDEVKVKCIGILENVAQVPHAFAQNQVRSQYELPAWTQSLSSAYRRISILGCERSKKKQSRALHSGACVHNRDLFR